MVKGAGSPITVEGNHVRSVETTGISVEDQAMANLAGNTVADASTGINIARVGTSATLTGNRVTETTERGIHVQLVQMPCSARTRSPAPAHPASSWQDRERPRRSKPTSSAMPRRQVLRSSRLPPRQLTRATSSAAANGASAFLARGRVPRCAATGSQECHEPRHLGTGRRPGNGRQQHSGGSRVTSLEST